MKRGWSGLWVALLATAAHAEPPMELAAPDVVERARPPLPELVEFPAGPFTMGCEGELPACADDRRPIRRMTLSAFAIERRPVTQGQYAACKAAGACPTPAEWAFFEPETKADEPVVGVTWGEAEAYCRWKGRRLPTEAEWARAARGTDGRLYPWGPGQWPAGDGATPEGVEGLIGSVKQWVADWYTVDGYARLAERDPAGDPSGTRKALRGLEALFGRDAPATFRASRHPEITDTGIGVRCAVSLGPRTLAPSKVPPPATDGAPWTVVDVAAGEAHTCAVDADGGLWCWGDDRFRQLAPGHEERARRDSLRPQPVPGVRAAAVEAGPLSTCSRSPAGWVHCWGRLDGIGAASRFAVGGRLCAVLAPPSDPSAAPLDPEAGRRGPPPAGFGQDGWLACTDSGASPLVPLLDPTTRAPVEPRVAIDLAVGHEHACAVDPKGRPWCWGRNHTGQLGVDGEDDQPQPRLAGDAGLGDFRLPPLLERLGPVAELAVGSHHTCARHRSGRVSCWGRGTYGALGRPMDRSHPDLARDRSLGPLSLAMALPVVGIDDARMLVDGQDHTCAVRADGSLWCWGDNRGGQLGDGTIHSRATPAPVIGLPGPVIAADAGRHHTCAIVGRGERPGGARPGGELYCWGENDNGELGDGTRMARRRPTRVHRPR